MDTFSHVPPGFRFHPTDEELVDYYLRKKVTARRIDLDVIKDVDLYKIEPWNLQELCRIGGSEEQSDWYFFSHKDKKYPTGTRTNRATVAGFWKATGRDKAIYTKHELIGMRKTLVFYKGRAPNGQKSDWIMHEYRLETDENGAPQKQEEGWVVCRVFKKKLPTMRRMSEHESPCWYEEHVSFMPDLDSPNHNTSINNNNNHMPYHGSHHFPNYQCKKELDHHQFPFQHHIIPNDQQHFFQLPHLESPKIMHQSSASASMSSNSMPTGAYGIDINQNFHAGYGNSSNELQGAEIDDELTDWRVLDKFVASQLSQDDVAKGTSYS